MQNKKEYEDAPCANDLEKNSDIFELDYDKEYQNNGKKLITMINGKENLLKGTGENCVCQTIQLTTKGS